jgi:centromere-localized protein 2
MSTQLADHGRNKQPHSLATVHASIQEACQCLEAQIADLEEESASALTDVHEVVGALSDVRHGRFAQPASGEHLGDEVLAILKRLETVCADPVG